MVMNFRCCAKNLVHVLTRFVTWKMIREEKEVKKEDVNLEVNSLLNKVLQHSKGIHLNENSFSLKPGDKKWIQNIRIQYLGFEGCKHNFELCILKNQKEHSKTMSLNDCTTIRIANKYFLILSTGKDVDLISLNY